MSSTPLFAQLGLSPQTISTLTKRGYNHPTPIQTQLIPAVLETTSDIMAQAATGTGKTGAFGIPLIDQLHLSLHAVQALVIAPTRELAAQVSRELRLFAEGRPIVVVEMCGGSGMREQISELKSLKKATIVVGTPGRILDHLLKKRLRTHDLQWFVLDEVDEMLNFGFKDDIDKIVAFLPENRRTIVLSATYPKSVKATVNHYLSDPIVINAAPTQADKPAIHEQYYAVKKISKFQLLCRVIDALPNFYGFIFCNTKREVDELSKQMIHAGYLVDSLHGDLSQSQRNRAFERFTSKQCSMLIVTDVAARGIDVKNISNVINLSVPLNLDVYTHRIGRTGRAGQSGVAITFVGDSQFGKFKRLIAKRSIEKQNIPSPSDILASKKAALLNQLNQVAPKPFYMELAMDLVKGIPTDDAMARLLQLRCADIFKRR